MDKFKCEIGLNLREVPIDVKAFKSGIQELEAKLETEVSNHKKAKLLSKLGVCNRVIGELDKSMEYLLQAEKLLLAIDDKNLIIVNQVRIACTLQFQNKNEEANLIYQNIEKTIKLDSDLTDRLDFVYQHWGKNLFEQGKLNKAVEKIEKAMELRKVKKDESLIQSSQLALKIIKNNLLN